MITRRTALGSALGASIAGACVQSLQHRRGAAEFRSSKRAAKMRFGLVTYMWGADWDLPTLLANCQRAGAEGVELRTGHAHRVEPSLTAAQRDEVKRRFADCPVQLVGLGSNEDFHDVDPHSLARSIGRAKEFIKLSYDIGSSGVKVKPNDLPEDAPRDNTIEQIGRSLNELAAYAANLGQEVRLEVHGGCAPLPIIANIMDVADHPNAVVCWNCNPQDLEGEGLEYNFRLVQRRLGTTIHVRDLEGDTYPYAKLIKLLKNIKYDGWLLLEASDPPPNRVAALAQQRRAFDRLAI